MKQTIWKYPLRIVDEQHIEIPIGAKVLTVQMQGNAPYLWALVNPDARRESRFIRIFSTGDTMPEHKLISLLKYVATFQEEPNKIVWHVFEKL